MFVYSQFLSIEVKIFNYVKHANENIFDNDKRKNEQLVTFITMINENYRRHHHLKNHKSVTLEWHR